MLKTLPTNAARRARHSGVLLDHLAMLVCIAALAIWLQRALPLSALFTWKVTGLFIAGSSVTVALAIRHLSTNSLGAANRITLLRGGLVAMLFGFIGEAHVAWVVVAIAGAALSLDGVDGWLARRLGTASEFGARFDMETDALALVALTVLAWQYGKAGPWIVLAGLMRYGFVAAARVAPRLGRPLPPSWRRKAAFVVQAMALIVCLAPIVPSPLSDAIAFAGLVLLSASFAIDIVALAQKGDILATQSRA